VASLPIVPVLRRARLAADQIASAGIRVGRVTPDTPVDPRAMRRQFLADLWAGLQVVWPILSVLLLFMAAPGSC
jgi:hypothetical protein